MSDRRWRFGLVGLERGVSYGQLIVHEPKWELAAVCDVSQEALASFQQEVGLPDARCFTGYDDLLNVEMDAVIVATPIPAHAPQSIAAMEAGFHVLSEVTTASTIEECGRIIETVRRTGRTYMLAENCVYWWFIQEWMKIFQSGRLGEAVYAECEYLHPVPELLVGADGKPTWRAGMPLLQYSSHSLGPILMITGDRITRAMGLGQGHRITPATIDIQVALFETERGAIIKMLRSGGVPREPRIHYYALQGTEGFLETDRDGPGESYKLYVQGEMDRARECDLSFDDPSLPEWTRLGGHGTAEYSLMLDFVRAIESGRKPGLDEARAWDLCVPGLVAVQSAMQGGVWLEVPAAPRK